MGLLHWGVGVSERDWTQLRATRKSGDTQTSSREEAVDRKMLRGNTRESVRIPLAGGQIHFHWGMSLEVACRILGLYKCNYSLARGKELGAAARWKQGAGPDKTRWRAGFCPWALCLPPVP